MQSLKRKDEVKYRAAAFALKIITFTSTLPEHNGTKNITKILINQLVRCGTSIGANIVEGQAGSSRKDFIKYLEIALKNANETKYWLYLFRESGIGEVGQISALLTEAEEIAKMLGASIVTLKKNY